MISLRHSLEALISSLRAGPPDAWSRWLLLGLILPWLAACSTWQSAPLDDDKPRTRGQEANYDVVRVNYASDRKPTGNAAPAEFFGGERGELSYGYCEVSIPRSHKPGELESPSVWRLEFRADPDRHVVLHQLQQQPETEFFDDLQRRVAQTPGHKVLVFIHGYNVSFADAAMRTGQISYDLSKELQSEVVPIFYSWPSQASLGSYTVDETNIEWSQSNIRRFLEDVANRSGSDQIFVLAHSMGNRATARAMAQLFTERPELRARFRELMLIAPDIDADVFRRDIAPMLHASERPVTLYVSANDKALQASKALHGYPRLGEASDPMHLIPGIETLDASALETDFLGHSYYSYAGSVLVDIKEIMQGVGRAAQRSRLEEIVAAVGRYWRLRP